ncbi:sensor histidine kinase YesM [Ulvibacter sp. MAR_2010_11]|uniref:sensor histidine kinase n=1 Tax=Ulvibacter sp. MAR_2010_11 TaxID=1250229 RepID=UPI000C2B7104|nr:histidine kinase [Ulvibacter sp. MAR_2010_11]PKA83908.1 sensor histidine kinase YesM [Ulvibacter sp. MAR_2010_11]
MRYRLQLLLLLSLLLSGFASLLNAQTTVSETEVFVPFKVYKSEGDSLSVAAIISRPELFITSNINSGKTNTNNTYWVRADLNPVLNHLKSDSVWYLQTGSFYDITYYFQGKNSIEFKEYGPVNTKEKYSFYTPKDGVYFKAENLINERYLFFKIRFYSSNQNFNNLKLKLRTEASKKIESNYYRWKDVVEASRDYLFVGAFFIIFIFTFITYFVSKRLDFLFYSIYTLCLLLYLGRSAYNTVVFLTYDYTVFSLWLHSSLQVFINLFYVAFAKYYLETFKMYPKLNKAIHGIAIFLLIVILVNSYFTITLQLDPHTLVMNIHRLVMSVFAVCAVIYLVIYAKNSLAYFIIIGSLTFTAGALAMLFTEDRHYMMVGSVVEVLLFGLGLNYKLRKDNKEKIQLKQTAHDNQISALRAQMNPHFIFNSLSSIQHLIISGKKESSIKYLNKFSLLMRNLLESSIEANVVLSEEISLLEKYLELEALRFNNSFQYEITVDASVDPEAVEVPSLIVQPFVENAILHGLLKKTGNDKHLRIHFNRKNNHIICEVEDNGIGRSVSETKKSDMKKSKKSRGIEVTEKRLQLISNSEKDTIEIIDKTNEKGEPTGTLVIIKISI